MNYTPKNKKIPIILHTEIVIDSSHQLLNYDGNCSRQHGHSFFIEVWIKGYHKNQDHVGIIFDFGKVKELKDMLDHRHLNDLSPWNEGINPTAENLVMWIYDYFKGNNPILDFKIRIYETLIGKRTFAVYGDDFPIIT